MKVLIVFAAVVLSVSALSAQEHWANFKAKHGKTYKNIVEEKLRSEIFRNNLKKIEEHNAKYEAGLKTYKMAVNKFADLTQEEFTAFLKLQNGKRPIIKATRHVSNATAPESIDWREKGAVLEVKSQGECASCWAFSATGALEGQNAIVNGKKVSLSEQELLDCSGSYGNKNCFIGGYIDAAFEYVRDHGISSEEAYPYKAAQGKCSKPSSSVLKIKDLKFVDMNEEALKNAVGTIGPISVAIYSGPLMFYSSGIFEDEECFSDIEYLDHGILAVGYGTEGDKKFWTLKNSYGMEWGEDGFFRLARDANNQCGIANDAVYPIL